MATITHGPLSYILTSGYASAYYRFPDGVIAEVMRMSSGAYLLSFRVLMVDKQVGRLTSKDGKIRLPLREDDIYTQGKLFTSFLEINNFVRRFCREHRNYKWTTDAPWHWKNDRAPYDE